MRKTLAAATLIFLTISPAARADTAGGSYNGLALTPPMGFNDWNAYGCDVSAKLIEQTALAMHRNGMQAAGYKYVNIDDCWMADRDLPFNDPARATADRVWRMSPLWWPGLDSCG